MSRPLRVGVIGASARSGWARESHVPALEAVPGVELAAVVGRSQADADAAASAFGARVGYADARALFADPQIDIVTVAVKVPEHHDLVLGALAARKHVYCEWPLSPNLSQARELADAARDAGVKATIGLQARVNPAVTRASELLAEGAVGRVLGARCFSSSAAWGATTEASMVFAEQPTAGVNLVIIQGAHTLDLIIALVGAFSDASALATRQYPRVRVEGEDRSVDRETFDHLVAHGVLKAGGTFASEVTGGRPAGLTPFELVVMGDRGELALTGGAARGFQSGRFELTLDGERQLVAEGVLAGLPDTALNVACMYERLRDDIDNDTSEACGFEHAVRLTRLVEDFISASGDGRRTEANEWPC